MEKGLKVTTDACVLGALASHSQPTSALDIGTGSGLLSLMIAQKYPQCQVVGVELEYEVYKQACENVNNSKFKNQISMVHSDIADINFTNTFDLIVCNPPYFKNHLKSINNERNSAIHQTNLNYELLLFTIQNYLKKDGVAWIIYPQYESSEFQEVLLNYKVYISEIFKIFNKPNVLFREVLKIEKNKKGLIESELLIKDNLGEYTNDFNRLLEDYYL